MGMGNSIHSPMPATIFDSVIHDSTSYKKAREPLVRHQYSLNDWTIECQKLKRNEVIFETVKWPTEIQNRVSINVTIGSFSRIAINWIVLIPLFFLSTEKAEADHASNMANPNSEAFKKAQDNHSNQLNPNSEAFKKGQDNRSVQLDPNSGAA